MIDPKIQSQYMDYNCLVGELYEQPDTDEDLIPDDDEERRR